MIENIHLLMASQTGGAEDAVDETRHLLESHGISVEWHDLAEREDLSFLKEASFIIGVVSTWGDGEPPDDATPFFEKLRSQSPLSLPDTPIAILGLGDSGYDIFCGCGKELEAELIRHGGKSIIPRVDCDVWFDDELKQWHSDLILILRPASAT